MILRYSGSKSYLFGKLWITETYSLDRNIRIETRDGSWNVEKESFYKTDFKENIENKTPNSILSPGTSSESSPQKLQSEPLYLVSYPNHSEYPLIVVLLV